MALNPLFSVLYMFQTVPGHVRMEGHSMQQTVHVIVQMVTVGLLAEVTKLHVGDIKLRNILQSCL